MTYCGSPERKVLLATELGLRPVSASAGVVAQSWNQRRQPVIGGELDEPSEARCIVRRGGEPNERHPGPAGDFAVGALFQLA
jgi:hypothetical protein